MDHAATTGASVYEHDGVWMLALESSTGEVVERLTTAWDGAGTFDLRGPDFVAPLLTARGLVYTRWFDQDGRHVAVLHRQASWGPNASDD